MAQRKHATSEAVKASLPKELVWLADAPHFIDALHVQEFYNAVVQPSSQIVRVIAEDASGGTLNLRAQGKAGATFDLSNAFGALGRIFSGLGKASVEAEAEGQYERASTESTQVERVPIETPQRQLLALTLHYLSKQSDRIFLIDDPADATWRTPKVIVDVPRALIFLEFHGSESNESENAGGLGTLLIPTAAEFANGVIAPIFTELTRKNGEKPPKYPETGKPSDLKQARREYWQWFKAEFSAEQAMRAVEAAASKNGRIQWIDYRVPITGDGDTLHLHICPDGRYDTGVFAYNFIKRGFKHGIRLVGTLKSEPDLNVLAIYER
jgi:hypothetical protein